MYKTCHLTSAHPRFDTRIFIKQCCSLAKEYQVTLLVADGLGDEIKNNVSIYDVGEFNGRRNRMFYAPKALLKKALSLDADIYHLHDPELMPIGLKLKKLGKKVIFDAHEDLPSQVLSKHYLNPFVKKPLSMAIKIFESHVCSRLDGVVAATPFIRDKFLKINSNTVDINNYPKLEEFNTTEISNKAENQVCYIGALTDVRGIVEMVESIEVTKNTTQLKIAGSFADKLIEQKVNKMFGWNKVDYLGFVNREDIKNILSESVVGLVILHPTLSYVESLPVKMFEYMCAGIPVIASDFPLWRSIIDETKCGLCVNPLKPYEVAKAIDYFIDNPEKAITMGRNGKNAVIKKYNWDIEEAKLFHIYNKLLT